MLTHRAVELATDRDVFAIAQCQKEFTALIESEEWYEAFTKNVEFHKRLYSIAQNAEADMLLEGRTRLVRTVGDSLGGYNASNGPIVVAEHDKIVDAFSARDAWQASRAVFEHVTAARERLIKRINAGGVVAAP